MTSYRLQDKSVQIPLVCAGGEMSQKGKHWRLNPGLIEQGELTLQVDIETST